YLYFSLVRFGKRSSVVLSSTLPYPSNTAIQVPNIIEKVLDKTTELLFPKRSKLKNKYSICILILIIGTFLITYEFDKSGDFGILVNFATSISFIIAPVIAIFNYLVVNRYLDNKFTPPKWLNYLSIIGVLYLTLFSILYLFKNYLFI
ncbi:MAG: hypothetical protein P8I02_01570, partial [Flavobacteriales bacterium]|nr:hypothetical protein [Flavobacteriales bacterium]